MGNCVPCTAQPQVVKAYRHNMNIVLGVGQQLGINEVNFPENEVLSSESSDEFEETYQDLVVETMKTLKKGKPFKDQEFPPDNKSLIANWNKINKKKNNHLLSKKQTWREYEWHRAEALASLDKKGRGKDGGVELFLDGI